MLKLAVDSALSAAEICLFRESAKARKFAAAGALHKSKRRALSLVDKIAMGAGLPMNWVNVTGIGRLQTGRTIRRV